MNPKSSVALRVVYCFVILAPALLYVFSNQGLVRLIAGDIGMGFVPLMAPLVFLVLGLYRVYFVVRIPGLLDAPKVKGMPGVLRSIGVLLMCIEGLIYALVLSAGPLMRMSMTNRSDNGVEFFVIGMYFMLTKGIGVLGLLVFEFGRLLAFEYSARQQST